MAQHIHRRGPAWYWRPIAGAWRAASFVERRFGIIAAMLAGVVLMLAGLIMSLTIAGAVIGIPMFILGAILIARSLY